MSDQLDRLENDLPNPLDNVEEVLTAHNWVFNRMNNDELIVQVQGKSCNYRLFFIWQEDMNAVQFCAQYDIVVPANQYQKAASAMLDVNENLWLGHFDLPKDSGAPTFRQTCLFRGIDAASSMEHIEDMVDVALAQCERYYPVFYLLSNDNEVNDQNLSLALMETVGES